MLAKLHIDNLTYAISELSHHFVYIRYVWDPTFKKFQGVVYQNITPSEIISCALIIFGKNG